jgi:hypothetical protein
MQVQNKGSVALWAVIVALAVGALLFLGVNSANNQAAQTVVGTSQAVVPSVTPPVSQPTITTSGSVDTELQSIDTKVGGLDTYQKNIDSAINDKPIDTGL